MEKNICNLTETKIFTNTTHNNATSSIVSFKEMFIMFLFCVLLLYSIISFFNNWSKNYRGINHLPYYAGSYSQDNFPNGNVLNKCPSLFMQSLKPGLPQTFSWNDNEFANYKAEKMFKIVRVKLLTTCMKLGEMFILKAKSMVEKRKQTLKLSRNVGRRSASLNVKIGQNQNFPKVQKVNT